MIEPLDQAMHCMRLIKQTQCNELQYWTHGQAYFARKYFGELVVHLHQFHLVAESGRGSKTMMPDIEIPYPFTLVLRRCLELGFVDLLERLTRQKLIPKALNYTFIVI